MTDTQITACDHIIMGEHHIRNTTVSTIFQATQSASPPGQHATVAGKIICGHNRQQLAYALAYSISSCENAAAYSLTGCTTKVLQPVAVTFVPLVPALAASSTASSC